MANPWETDNCAAMKAHYAVYSIPQAAALWCGVPENKVHQIVQEARQLSPSRLGRSMWTHPTVPCLEPRSRAPEEHIEFLGMAWETEGFLHGCRLHFNENLNVLIGGRGSGKSSVIESLRYVLGIEYVGLAAIVKE